MPGARHREAWAVEETAPTQAAWAKQEAQESSVPRKVITVHEQPTRRVVSVAATPEDDRDLPKDILVVVSKLKKYIKAKSDMKTSETVIPVLSQELRRICDRAIRIAGEHERKTVLDRDVRDALDE